MTVQNITYCRICRSMQLENVIDLGDQYVTSRFPNKGDFSTPICPITLCMCHRCGLLQLRQTTLSSELYEHEYGYRSGISNTMRNHLQSYHTEVLAKADLKDGDWVLDIGSNDATFLKFYNSSNFMRVGIDPTGKQFQSFYEDEPQLELIADYFTADNFKERFPDKKCKVVTSIAMFYDLPDPVRFAKDIYEILEDDGIWTCEQSYLISMLETNSVDTICHEHLEYYALFQIKEIADRANFKILDVRFNESNGGSFRVYFAKRTSSVHQECLSKITSILETEKSYGIATPKLYHDFLARCREQADRLKSLINAINSSGKKIWIYGASTKGNCTLQFAGITNKDIEFAVERNPKKFGKMTPTGVEIISEETMRSDPPGYLLVLPWHFKKEIIEREQAFLENGGTLVFPFPQLELVSLKPRVLVTGCDGHIASYFLDHYAKQYDVYGISNSKDIPIHHNMTRYQFDLNNHDALCNTILTLKPDAIVHLGGISRSQQAMEKPLDALQTNGMVVAVICDCIYRNHLDCKVFHASSSEIFKGHGVYNVREYDHHYYHLHPYSIAKIMGHSVVDYYRQEHNMPFSNGILFTTESVRKSPDFLLNKVARHASEWNDTKKPLALGNLASARNIVHASDAAHAIHSILTQEDAANYVICNDSSISVLQIVLDIYKAFGIKLRRKGDAYVDEKTGEIVFTVSKGNSRSEQVNNIQGDNSRLKGLGWEPEYKVYDIIEELRQAYDKRSKLPAVAETETDAPEDDA